MAKKLNILIAYIEITEFPMRRSTSQYIYAFKNYLPNCRVFHVNLAAPWICRSFLESVDFDLIFFHRFMQYRTNPLFLKKWAHRIEWVKNRPCPKAIFPQDEYIGVDQLLDFIDKFSINKVFTLSPESEWEKIYGPKDQRSFELQRVLPGYLDDKTLHIIEGYVAKNKTRPIDIGYRARKPTPSLGQHGWLKSRIGDLFASKAKAYSLHCDISNRVEDTFLGDSWYDFLTKCKYTLGVEGGASVIDRDGSLERRVREFQWAHPEKSCEEIASQLFPNRDGEIWYFAISPRHLEACATKTCQVLVEGDYNGILKKDVHYISLKKDLSNVDEVLSAIKSDQKRQAIVDRAYHDIVLKGHYGLKDFVAEVMRSMEPMVPERVDRGLKWSIALGWNRVTDFLSFVYLVIYFLIIGKPYAWIRPIAIRLISEKKFQSMVDWLRYGSSSKHQKRA